MTLSGFRSYIRKRRQRRQATVTLSGRSVFVFLGGWVVNNFKIVSCDLFVLILLEASEHNLIEVKD